MPEGKRSAPPPLTVIGGPPRAPRAPRPPLPLWAKWALSLGVGAVLLVVLIVFVDTHNSDYSPGYPVSPKAQAEANREATVLVEQDQAPRVLRLAAGLTGPRAVAHAVHTVMLGRIDDNQASPPLKAARCRATSRGTGGPGFSCTVRSGGVYYDFVGVIAPAGRTITLCKRDPPPVPSQTVPTSRRCLP